MKNNKIIATIATVIVAILVLVGYIKTNTNSVESKTVVYRDVDTVVVYVDRPVPINVIVPKVIRDTINEVIIVNDTTFIGISKSDSIFTDYYSVKNYNGYTTIDSLNIHYDATVSNNRLESLKHTYSGKIKTEIVTHKPKLNLKGKYYGTFNYSSTNDIQIGAGLFAFKRIGIHASISSSKVSGLTASVGCLVIF